MAGWVARYLDHTLEAVSGAPPPEIATRSAIAEQPSGLDVICTDPPYYDAIPYSDLIDFFLLSPAPERLQHDPAPVGACILYAISCNLSDTDLAGRYDLITRGKATSATDVDDGSSGTSGSDVRLKQWKKRRRRDLGFPGSDGTGPALIDCLHKLMELWRTGEQSRVDSYLNARGLWKCDIFASVVQGVLEMAEPGSGERKILESVSNHLGGVSPAAASLQRTLRLN